MNLLLDTHTFIWWADEPEKFSESALQELEAENNQLLLSIASIWEIQIKTQLGKLKLSLSLQDLLESQEQTNNLKTLPITKAHVFAFEDLPPHHKDPFDRLLIAQSIVENLTVVSVDSKLSAYSVTLLW